MRDVLNKREITIFEGKLLSYPEIDKQKIGRNYRFYRNPLEEVLASEV